MYAIKDKGLEKMLFRTYAGKKGMELSLNTVIVAALVVIVLIVITIIFTKGIGKSNKSIFDCENKNGKVCASRADCLKINGVPIFEIDETSGKSAKKVCCIPLYGGTFSSGTSC